MECGVLEEQQILQKTQSIVCRSRSTRLQYKSNAFHDDLAIVTPKIACAELRSRKACLDDTRWMQEANPSVDI